MTLTKDNIEARGYELTVLTGKEVDMCEPRRCLLFMDCSLNWCMVGADCGVEYWYNVSVDACTPGSYIQRKKGVCTTGYPVTAMLVYRINSYDMLRIARNDRNSAFMNLQDLVYMFNDEVERIRKSAVNTGEKGLPEDAEVPEGHVKLFTHYPLYVGAVERVMLEDISRQIWAAAHHGIEGVL